MREQEPSPNDADVEAIILALDTSGVSEEATVSIS